MISSPVLPSTSPRQNNFNLLRLILATVVLVSHSMELYSGDREKEVLVGLFHSMALGDVAVAGFFCLSGFLIVQSWLHRPVLKEFLLKRALRILPGFVVAFVISVLTVGYLSGGAAFFREVNPLLLLRNLLTLSPPGTPPVFLPQRHPYVNVPMWTISHEAECYLLVALLGTLGLFASMRKLVVGLVLLGLPLIILQVSGASKFLPTELQLLTTFNFYRLVCYFLCGMFFYFYRDRIPLSGRGAIVAAILFCVAMLMHFRALPYLLVAAPVAYLVFWFASLQTPWLQKARTWPDFSYGIYLYAWPIQKITIFYFPTVPLIVLLVAQILITAFCGALSWYYIEKPALKWKPKPSATPQPSPVIEALIAP